MWCEWDGKAYLGEPTLRAAVINRPVRGTGVLHSEPPQHSAVSCSLEVSRFKSTSLSLVFGNLSCLLEGNKKRYWLAPTEMNYRDRSHWTRDTQAQGLETILGLRTNSFVTGSQEED